jgi:ribosomal protein L11 methyltransferase
MASKQVKPPNPLWRLSVVTTREAEEAVTELLASELRQAVVSYTDLETGESTVTGYLERRSDWSKRRQVALRASLERIRDCGLRLGPSRICFSPMRRKDWVESWKRHFKPLVIGSRLLIKPSWSRRQPRPGQAVVILDPGLSFGTGQHPTTSFCLTQLANRRRAREAQSMLDIGTGSGILAIAAAKLGYSPIDAFDVDPEAIRVASSNARRNRVSDRIRFARKDLASLSFKGERKYSLVCANLIATLLVAERDRILASLAPTGVLVVAGILRTEFGRVESAYAAAGLHVLANRTGKEWRSAALGRVEKV